MHLDLHLMWAWPKLIVYTLLVYIWKHWGQGGVCETRLGQFLILKYITLLLTDLSSQKSLSHCVYLDSNLLPVTYVLYLLLPLPPFPRTHFRSCLFRNAFYLLPRSAYLFPVCCIYLCVRTPVLVHMSTVHMLDVHLQTIRS